MNKEELNNCEKMKFEELRHKYKMEELSYERETERRIHEGKLEAQRIKSAEIKKSMLRKESYGRSY